MLDLLANAQRLYDLMSPDDTEDPTADAASNLRKCLDEFQLAYANTHPNWEHLYELAAQIRADAEQIEHAVQFQWQEEP
ncbi:MAG: hypothetical protein QM586_11620 [Xenophilus sp.]